MSVLSRYIARELTLTFLVLLVVILIVALGGRFIGYLQEAAVGRFDASVLWDVVVLRLPEFIQMTVPFAFLVSCLLTFGRLHADCEFAVLLASGLRPARIIVSLVATALVPAVFVGVLSLEITPRATRAFEELAFEQLVSSEFRAIVPGEFHGYGHGVRVTYAEKVDLEGRRLLGVFMSEKESRRNFATVWAQTGRYFLDEDTGSRYLLLDNGVRYEGAPGQAGYRVVTFSKLGQRVNQETITASGRGTATSPTWDLVPSRPRHAAELHKRFSFPLMTVIGSLCALGLARVPPRAGRFGKILPGVALFVAYYLLCVITQVGIENGIVPPHLGVWPIHGLMVGVSNVLLYRSFRPT